MGKWLLVLSLGVAIGSAAPALAQRGPGGPGGPGGGGDSVRKLQAEIDKLQAEIKELEARSKKGRDAESRADERSPQPKGALGGFTPLGHGGFGPQGGFGGHEGFVPKDVKGGPRTRFAPKDDRAGPGRGLGGFGGGFGHDSKSLEMQLHHLHAASKLIAERTKEVEEKLKLAKANEARKSDRQDGPGDRGPKGRGGPGDSPESKHSSSIESRLDRIEKVLEELQKSMRQKR